MSIASSVSAKTLTVNLIVSRHSCHGSEDLCGPSLLSTSSPGHTTPSPIPITTDPVGITTTASSASFDWDGYCREQVDGVSYCKYWSEPPVCHGSEVPCSGPAAPTPTTPNVTPGNDPYDCFKTLQCDADTDGAIAELESIFGTANILTGDKIPSVFMPQYTGVQPLAAIRPRSEDDILIIMDVAANSKSKADVLAKTKAYQNVMINQPSSNGLWGKVKIHSNFEMHYEGMCLCDPITSDCTDCDETMDKVDSAVQANTWITKPSQKFTNAAYGAWSWAGCTKWADPDCPSDAVYPGTGVDPTSAMDNCWAYDWSLNENLPWKSNSVYVRESDMTDSFWDTIWDLSHQPECQKGRNICIITFEYYGGKMLDEPTDCSGAGPCTSFIHRHQGWNVQVSSLWNKGDSAGEETSTNWVAKAFAAIDQFSSLEESYQNYISNQWTVERWKDKFFPGQDVQPDHWKYRYFGPLSNGVYNRLQEVKCHYNPYNLFTTPTTADIVVQLPTTCTTTST
ncbi:hypothetical protein FOZ60_005043 [Perkinsus olseni]|uniref:Berberine/berberine-like domain-containing protein n=1 Tax=Perkinsus olseni TaxID=32597 RepID=A0A7J6NRT9_PEROL|nr:hypothetical protein FOZ60_005043 [Perkinsus olseni]